jgi:hypothetical protein
VHLTGSPDPAKTAGEHRAGADCGGRRPGEECSGRDDYTDREQGAQSVPDEPDECVVHRRGRVGRQLAVRHAVQVDAARDEQRYRQDEHRCSHAEAGSDQRPPMAAGDIDPGGQQEERRDRKDDLEIVDHPVEGLGLHEVFR